VLLFGSVVAANRLAARSLPPALRRIGRRLIPGDGQTSAEYALVLLGAAGVALLVGAWAGQTDRVGKLLDAIFDGVIRTVKAG
jgi:hypothetical protein